MSLTLLAPVPLGMDEDGGPELMGNNAWLWTLARDDPWRLLELHTYLAVELRRDPEAALKLFATGQGEVDQAALLSPDDRDGFVETFIESTRQGSACLAEDMRVLMKAWGFDPASVRVPATMWLGAEDSLLSEAISARWAETVRGLRVHVLPGLGHAFPLVCSEQIITALRAASL
jgi:pimeloyl-ACP methyl ester carboxylesterase